MPPSVLTARALAPRESAVSRLLYEPRSLTTQLHGMPVMLERSSDSQAVPVGLADASALPRFGMKGPEAQRFLEARGVALPPRVNSYVRDPSGHLGARLGRTEFFLEDPPNGTRIADLRKASVAASGVYPVPRQDAAFVLCGARAERVLAQTTNFDFRNLCREANEAVLTLMAGVSVLVLGYELGGAPHYRIWCDPSFGAYLCRTLLGIVQEEGGSAIGLLTALGQSQEKGASPEAAPLDRSSP